MELSKNELKDIRTTIEWLIKNTKLVENNRTNLETLYNTATNSICTIDRAIGEFNNENSGLHKHDVTNPVCPLCKGKGEYSFGGSFGGAVQTVICPCGANGL